MHVALHAVRLSSYPRIHDCLASLKRVSFCGHPVTPDLMICAKTFATRILPKIVSSRIVMLPFTYDCHLFTDWAFCFCRVSEQSTGTEQNTDD